MNYLSFFNVLLIPLGISIGYSLLIPFLSLIISVLIIWPSKKSIGVAHGIRKERKEKEKEIATLDHEIEKNRSGELTIAELNSQIKALEETNQEYLNQNTQIRENLKKIETEKLKQSSSIDYISSTYSNYLFDLISQRYSDQDRIKVLNALTLLNSGDVDLDDVENEILNDLVHFKIVTRNKDLNSGSYAYFITDFGKLFINQLLNSNSNAK